MVRETSLNVDSDDILRSGKSGRSDSWLMVDPASVGRSDLVLILLVVCFVGTFDSAFFSVVIVNCEAFVRAEHAPLNTK